MDLGSQLKGIGKSQLWTPPFPVTLVDIPVGASSWESIQLHKVQAMALEGSSPSNWHMFNPSLLREARSSAPQWSQLTIANRWSMQQPVKQEHGRYESWKWRTQHLLSTHKQTVSQEWCGVPTPPTSKVTQGGKDTEMCTGDRQSGEILGGGEFWGKWIRKDAWSLKK